MIKSQSTFLLLVSSSVLRSFATGDQHQVVRCFVEFISTPVALWLGLNDVGCLESIGEDESRSFNASGHRVLVARDNRAS